MDPDNFNQKLQQARQFMQRDHHVEALKLYAKLVREFPKGGLTGEYARAAAVSGDFDLADKIWKKIQDFEPNTTDLLSRLAWEYQNIRLHAKARELYTQAADLDRRSLDHQLSLAWLLSRTASVDEAREAVTRCAELDARHEQVRFLTAHLDRRENKHTEAEQQFRDLLAASPQDPYVKYSCHSELAQILDRTERFEEAMAELAIGKNITRQVANADDEQVATAQWHESELRKAKALPKNILETWNQGFPLRSRKPAASVAFLTGPARSGTTLLEKILDAHPNVAASDESLAFGTIQPRIDVTAPVVPWDRLNILRQRYLKNFCKVLGAESNGKTLLDKNPSRTAWLPNFLRVFPELRVLLALRDPRDIMVSLYFQNQTKTNNLTFEQLAQYYVHMMEMWLVVKEWNGLAWLETRYEDIVTDLQKEGSRVTKFLGLEWNENQASFFEKNREKPILSTNYTAVTQPVYARSVGRWRAYEKHLTPILPVLEPYCKKFGYT